MEKLITTIVLKFNFVSIIKHKTKKENPVLFYFKIIVFVFKGFFLL